MYAFAPGFGSDFNVMIEKKITLKTNTKSSSRELVIF